jgi:hypothetical protein
VIAFAPDEGDEPESLEAEQSAYERYTTEQLKSPEYQRLLIGLKRMARVLSSIRERWRVTSRHQTLAELDNLLDRQHELEKQAEIIEDVFMREYIYGRLDEIAVTRRSLSEDIRWDIRSGLGDAGALDVEWSHR